MKQISTLVNAILAALMILILLTTGVPNFSARAATQTPEPPSTQDPENLCNNSRTIQVSGTAVVNVAPDRALLQLGVESNGRTPKEVQGRNAATLSKVLKAVKALRVEAKDISTDHYVIEPIYAPSDSLFVDGYRIHNVVSITLRDVNKTSDVIAAAFEEGANQVVNVEFFTSELRKYRDQAREMAMKAASEKASALAEAAGAHTECVLSINENSWSYFNGWAWWYGGGNQNIWTQNAVQNAEPANSGTPTNEDSPVSMGQISIRAEVSAMFALK